MADSQRRQLRVVRPMILRDRIPDEWVDLIYSERLNP